MATLAQAPATTRPTRPLLDATYSANATSAGTTQVSGTERRLGYAEDTIVEMDREGT